MHTSKHCFDYGRKFSIISYYFLILIIKIFFSALFFEGCRIKYKTDIYLAQYIFILLFSLLCEINWTSNSISEVMLVV